MIKQSTIGITILLLILLLIPAIGFSEWREYSKAIKITRLDISNLNANELYQLYVETVEMNNSSLQQINQLGHIYDNYNTGIDKLEFNLTELELLEIAKVESYRLFKKGVKDKKGKQEFVAKMNENATKRRYNFNSNISN